MSEERKEFGEREMSLNGFGSGMVLEGFLGSESR